MVYAVIISCCCFGAVFEFGGALEFVFELGISLGGIVMY